MKIFFANHAIKEIYLTPGSGRGDSGHRNAPLPPLPDSDRPLIRETIRQLDAYFSQKLKIFSLPFIAEGSSFRHRVWEELRTLPYGTTDSYGNLARRLGRPGGAPAVGGACRLNPLPLLIPCHRVIGRNGKLTGYAGGTALKRKLLRLEGASPQQ